MSGRDFYLSGSILEEQVFDGGLHSDVGPDHKLQSTGGWVFLGMEEQSGGGIVRKRVLVWSELMCL